MKTLFVFALIFFINSDKVGSQGKLFEKNPFSATRAKSFNDSVSVW